MNQNLICCIFYVLLVTLTVIVFLAGNVYEVVISCDLCMILWEENLLLLLSYFPYSPTWVAVYEEDCDEVWTPL